MSRGVTCGIVSIPASRWIAIDAINAFIRARAIGLSFTSTKPTAPDASSVRATAIMASFVPPFGGSSSTLTTHWPSRERARQLRLACGGRGGEHLGPLVCLERRARSALVVERRPDRLDLGRRRAAAAADDAGAERDRLGREVAEVFGRRVGIDDAAAGDAGEADVRQRRERQARVAHAVEREQRSVGAGAVIRPDRGHVEAGESLGRGGRVDPPGHLGVVVEGEERHDRE